jgi:hypothetical protein
MRSRCSKQDSEQPPPCHTIARDVGDRIREPRDDKLPEMQLRPSLLFETQRHHREKNSGHDFRPALSLQEMLLPILPALLRPECQFNLDANHAVNGLAPPASRFPRGGPNLRDAPGVTPENLIYSSRNATLGSSRDARNAAQESSLALGIDA